MKRIFYIFLSFYFIHTPSQIFGQCQILEFLFEGNDECELLIDTAKNQNIWEIGHPSKTIFDDGYFSPNAIVTDTINPYPINNTSSFTIPYEVDEEVDMDNLFFSAAYNCDTDLGNDHATFEMSCDSGNSWIDLLDPALGVDWSSDGEPTFTGSSGGWQFINANLFYPWLEGGCGNSILLRLTFISDSIFDSKDGLMLDNIQLYGLDASTGDLEDEHGFNIYPNPASDLLFIESQQMIPTSSGVELLDQYGRHISIPFELLSNRFVLNTRDLINGTYIYRIIDEKGDKIINGIVIILR